MAFSDRPSAIQPVPKGNIFDIKRIPVVLRGFSFIPHVFYFVQYLYKTIIWILNARQYWKIQFVLFPQLFKIRTIRMWDPQFMKSFIRKYQIYIVSFFIRVFKKIWNHLMLFTWRREFWKFHRNWRLDISFHRYDVLSWSILNRYTNS